MENTVRDAAAFRNSSGTNHSAAVLRFDAVSLSGSNPSSYQIEAASKQSDICLNIVGYGLHLLVLRGPERRISTRLFAIFLLNRPRWRDHVSIV